MSISHGIEKEPGRREVRKRRTHECNVVRALNANHSVQVEDVAKRLQTLEVIRSNHFLRLLPVILSSLLHPAQGISYQSPMYLYQFCYALLCVRQLS